MMITLASNLTGWNILNLILGLVFGFTLAAMITIAIIAKILAKYNKNEEIRKISKRTYTNFYHNKGKLNDKILSSLLYEIKEVSQFSYPDKKYPLYELSINEALEGIMIIQRKLEKFIDHPFCRDLRNVHIAKMMSFEENVARPIVKIYKNIFVQIVSKMVKFVIMILNFVNPFYYFKKILKWTLFKKGKKDMIIIGLDFIGNTCYEVYNSSKERNETNEKGQITDD